MGSCLNAWGSSWGSSWGNSWTAFIEVIIDDTHDGLRNKRIREEKEKLKDDVTKAFSQITGRKVAKPLQEVTVKKEIMLPIEKNHLASFDQMKLTQQRLKERVNDEEELLIVALIL